MSTAAFTIGENVVYPNHGVAVIEQISSHTVGTSVEHAYLLCFRSSSLKVTVPFQNAEAVGLRRVVENEEALKILEFLSYGECESSPDWKLRLKENSDRMRTGLLLEVATVLKSLLVQAGQKSLNAREKKMLESTRVLLSSEMAMARNHNQEEAEEELGNALHKCKLQWPEPESFEP